MDIEIALEMVLPYYPSHPAAYTKNPHHLGSAGCVFDF